MWEIVSAGGPIMWPIILCSILAAAIVRIFPANGKTENADVESGCAFQVSHSEHRHNLVKCAHSPPGRDGAGRSHSKTRFANDNTEAPIMT